MGKFSRPTKKIVVNNEEMHIIYQMHKILGKLNLKEPEGKLMRRTLYYMGFQYAWFVLAIVRQGLRNYISCGVVKSNCPGGSLWMPGLWQVYDRLFSVSSSSGSRKFLLKQTHTFRNSYFRFTALVILHIGGDWRKEIDDMMGIGVDQTA